MRIWPIVCVIALSGCVAPAEPNDGVWVVMIASNHSTQEQPMYAGGHAPGDLEAWHGAGRFNASSTFPPFTDSIAMYVERDTLREYVWEIRIGDHVRVFPYEGCTTLWGLSATLSQYGDEPTLTGGMRCRDATPEA